MELDGTRLFLLIVATVSVVLWVVFAFKNAKEYQDLTDTIDPEMYRYPELFCIGFTLMKLTGFNSRKPKARKRVKEISEIRGHQFAEYYYYLQNGAKYTYGFTLFTVASLIAALGGSLPMLLLGALLTGLIAWYLDEKFNDLLEERRDLLLSDFPQMLSKMALLVNSGMTVREAWKKISENSERPLYQEMKLTVQEMQNGVMELDAYMNFSERCSIKEIRRFAATMAQAMTKGNEEIAVFLRTLSDEMWEQKKNLIKRKGEAANSKLLIPTAMIFIGILIMIIVPSLSGL